jgi:hypothetical protein
MAFYNLSMQTFHINAWSREVFVSEIRKHYSNYEGTQQNG